MLDPRWRPPQNTSNQRSTIAKSTVAKSSTAKIDPFGEEQREKVDRIVENPGTYDGTDQLNARTWTEELGEDNSEAACPLGFMQESPIATAFCSDIDEVGFNFCSHVFTNMTHIYDS